MIATPIHGDAEIELVMTSRGREPGGGLVVVTDNFTLVHRTPIILLAAGTNIPAVYWSSVFAACFSYGPDYVDLWRRTAS